MKVTLVMVGGDVTATEIQLKLPAIIGRGREATIILPHPLVSRKHCELYEANGMLMVRDFGSLNGTYVGTQRVSESPLPPGELLTVATVSFRAIYGRAMGERVAKPPGAISSDDSTHGPVIEKSNSERGNRSDTVDVPAPRAKVEGAEPPIERNTEWQVGNAPPRNDSSDGDDFSSLLKDLR